MVVNVGSDLRLKAHPNFPSSEVLRRLVRGSHEAAGGAGTPSGATMPRDCESPGHRRPRVPLRRFPMPPRVPPSANRPGLVASRGQNACDQSQARTADQYCWASAQQFSQGALSWSRTGERGLQLRQVGVHDAHVVVTAPQFAVGEALERVQRLGVHAGLARERLRDTR